MSRTHYVRTGWHQLDCALVTETGAAVLVQPTGTDTEVWVPKSVTGNLEAWRDGETVFLEIEDWWIVRHLSG